MKSNYPKLIRNLLLAGVCVVLTACAPRVQSTSPDISLHPTKMVNQLQLALMMTAPANPVQYSNANALVANNTGKTSSNVTNPSATSSAASSNDQVFKTLSVNASQSSQPLNKNAAQLAAAKVHAITILRPQIENILAQYGFVPVSYSPQLQRKLTVQLVDVDTTHGLQATLEVDAINGMLTYSRTYTSSASSVSIGSLNDRVKNLYADMLTQALGDTQLINFLNQP